MSKKIEQDKCGIYNAYKSGLFGHHHSKGVISTIGLDERSYGETVTNFQNLCNRLGGRVLNMMENGSALVTPESISPELSIYMGRVFGVDTERVTFINAEGIEGSDLPTRILSDGKSMDVLRRWARGANNPVIHPRTETLETLAIAKDIGAAHIHQMPYGTTRIVDGIYPSVEYLEKHTANELNSKVLNYQLLKEVDQDLGTETAPEGDVAFDLDRAVEIVQSLWISGKDVIIKADLSVDGMGNVNLLRPKNKISNEVLRKDIKKELHSRGIPIGKDAGVVVTERLALIYDPSTEWFSPPLKWGIRSYPYYSCAMIIEKGGFGGSIIEDPALNISRNNPGVPEDLIRRNKEYKSLIREGNRVGTEFVRRLWGDGYVGISDCDFGISNGADGNLRINILEFNNIRETGGTAAYQIKNRLGKNGFSIARDSVEGYNMAKPFDEIISDLSADGLELTANRKRGKRGGVLVLGQEVKNGMGKIMTLTYGESYSQAYKIDQELVRRTK